MYDIKNTSRFGISLVLSVEEGEERLSQMRRSKGFFSCPS